MSRQIDPDNLSDEDRKYLEDRAIDPDQYAEQHRLRSGEVKEGEEPGRLGQAGGPEADEGDGEDVPYSEWTIAELRTEVENREIHPELNRKLRKGELIALLETADQSDAPRGTTDDDDEDTSLDPSDAQPANPAGVDRGVLNRE